MRASSHWIDNEAGAATIIEYTIVLPIVMAIICILMFTGYILYDRATLEAAAERTALYMSKAIADQNYQGITTRSKGANEIDQVSITPGSIKTAPYRFLFGNVSDIATSLEGDARELILENQLLRNDNVNVVIKPQRGVFYKVTVSVTEEFNMPTFLATLDLPPLVSIETQAVVYVNEPAEFIRNADLTIELVRKVDEKLGISAKIEEVVSQISFFKSKTN